MTTDESDSHRALITQPASMTEEEMGSGFLKSIDIWWRERFDWLHEHGYELRPRFHPDWVPSWKGTKKAPFECEDGISIFALSVLDAVRISDGSKVMLKRVDEKEHPHEADICAFLSSEELRRDPRNHSVPVLEILRPPDCGFIIIVQPMLRKFWDPDFQTVGEVVGCIQQLFEGLAFLHEHHIAHRDCKYDNIMFDARPMYPQGWHAARPDENEMFTGDAKHTSRTGCGAPIRYYYIDFGIAIRFAETDDPPSAAVIMSGDRTVPEFQGNKKYERYNPFPTDVYLLGSALNQIFISGNESHVPALGLDFMEPLLLDMTEDDPAARPTMAEVVTRFEEIVASLKPCKLRAPIVFDEPWYINMFLWFGRTMRRITYTIRRLPPIPPAMEPSVPTEV